jgi:hypothetical protein
MSDQGRPIHCVCGRIVAFTDPEVEGEVERLRQELKILAKPNPATPRWVNEHAQKALAGRENP